MLCYCKIKMNTTRKLNNLNIQLTTNDIIVNPQFVNRRRNNMEKAELEPSFKPVFDLSGILDEEEKKLLGKGLKYGIKNKNFNQFEILARFEEFAENITKEEVVSVPNDDRYVTTPVDSFLQGLQTLAYEFVDNARTPQNSLTHDEEKTLKNLKMKVKDNSLIIRTNFTS